MRALVQRVASASVETDGRVTGAIGRGLLILLGVARSDTAAEAEFLAGKVARLRVFEDAGGRMNVATPDAGGDFLVVSQFTLYGDCRGGNRPSFIEAAPGPQAEPLYLHFVRALERASGRAVATGVFGAMMKVRLENDGPVTLLVETPPPATEGH